MAVMLDVKNINVYYGAIHAVKDISFQVNEGEIVTLIGANGAGKTTTLQTVSGLLHTRTGSIEFLGQPIQNVPASKLVGRGLAQVPEGRRVFQQMTVEENLEMGGFTQPASTIAPGLERVYEQFPRLKERRRQVAGTLSGGEQQMLAMGRALMSNPKLLMLDEPSMGLAPLLVEQIFDIIKELHRAGTTILLVEQNAQGHLGVLLHHDSPGGAERPDGPERGRPGLRAGDRAGHPHRPRPGAAGRRGRQKGIPGRLNGSPAERAPPGCFPFPPLDWRAIIWSARQYRRVVQGGADPYHAQLLRAPDVRPTGAGGPARRSVRAH